MLLLRNYTHTKSSQAEIIDFILADLENAISKLPLQSELTGDETGRVTKGAALASKQGLLYIWEHGQNIMVREIQLNI